MIDDQHSTDANRPVSPHVAQKEGQRGLLACWILDPGGVVRFSAGCIRRSCMYRIGSVGPQHQPLYLTAVSLRQPKDPKAVAFCPCLLLGRLERVSAQSVGSARVGAPRSCQLHLSLRAHQAAPRHQGCVNRQLSSPSSIPFTTAPPTAALLHSHPQRRARHDAPHRASRARAKRFLRTRCRRSVRKRCKRSHL